MPTFPASPDALVVGRRVRQLRKARGWNLQQLAQQVNRAPSALSMLENGRREPKLSLLRDLAEAFDVPVAQLLGGEALDRRAELEIALERAQASPLYSSLRLPGIRPGVRVPTPVLEALVGLHAELERQASAHLATPEEARRANRALRAHMRERGNYFGEIEAAAAEMLRAAGHAGGPLTERDVRAIAARVGFTLHPEADLPHAARSVIDLRHHRIFLPHPRDRRGHGRRQVALQAIGHIVLGHAEPAGYADFLRQRVEVNYFSAAVLVPEAHAVSLLKAAKANRDIAVEDLRDAFAVSYETAAHRFTNVATQHLGVPVHFMRVHESGTIYKAYENDGVKFPTDVTGAIEGQPACRHWTARAVFGRTHQGGAYQQYTDTPSGTYWCSALVEPGDHGDFSISVGVPYAHARWFRGHDTTERGRSLCPDTTCCRKPPASLSERWAGAVLASARAHTHLLAALPPGTFPGVDDTEVLRFLEARAAEWRRQTPENATSETTTDPSHQPVTA
ncbi:MAG: helix-turn-helix domain-containing protein [Sporichthyaceae bacterium]|nr:helix-turn-helix domain-containing protein [Sporichthyaceae bacterium]